MRNLLFIIIGCLICMSNYAQEELKWKGEIESIKKVERTFMEDALGTIVLTGSSSARMYKTVGDDFSDFNLINTGFGGSQMHELLYFLDDLVVDYKPDMVLIYEGDNDISAGKSSDEIMETTKKVVIKLKNDLPELEIFFISAKPSLARWNLAPQYVEFNTALKDYCKKTKNVEYIDVWSPMLNKEGTPIKDIFIGDGLHMNAKGYTIWKMAIDPLILNKK